MERFVCLFVCFRCETSLNSLCVLLPLRSFKRLYFASCFLLGVHFARVEIPWEAVNPGRARPTTYLLFFF